MISNNKANTHQTETKGIQILHFHKQKNKKKNEEYGVINIYI